MTEIPKKGWREICLRDCSASREDQKIGFPIPKFINMYWVIKNRALIVEGAVHLVGFADPLVFHDPENVQDVDEQGHK